MKGVVGATYSSGVKFEPYKHDLIAEMGVFVANALELCVREARGVEWVWMSLEEVRQVDAFPLPSRISGGHHDIACSSALRYWPGLVQNLSRFTSSHAPLEYPPAPPGSPSSIPA